jgi:hypothetical protein
MIVPTYNGWLSWSFNGVPYGLRTSKDDVYKFVINPLPMDMPVQSYKEELYNNARLMRDYHVGTFDVLLSGGIDSEIVVRTFKDLKISHNTYIFKYENNINYKDVESAIDIATNLNIPYKIIDFNLEKFFETDAYDVFKKSGCIRAGRLPHIKFFDYIDNIPVMGDAEPYWSRVLQKDYSKKSNWIFPLNEANHNASMYLHSISRPNICDWYEFSPNLIKAFNNLPLIQDLVDDKIPGKLSCWTSRIPIHREIWPDIKHKHKLTGYEGDNFTGVYPEYINKMQDYMTTQIGSGDQYWFTYDELTKLF